MGKAFRPSRVAADSEPAAQADNSLEKATRIRAYSKRVQLKLPLFEGETVGPIVDEVVGGR